MRYRHYIVVMVLTWILFIIIGIYGAMEPWRSALAEDRQVEYSLERGLELYARNCSVCHGPLGEGGVGKPLNPDYRVDFQGGTDKNRNAARYIKRIITDGVPGSGIPAWKTLPDGSKASYTAMPSWSNEKGGPFNEMHIEDLVNFIMLGDFSQVFAKVQELDKETEKAIVESLPEGKTLEDALPLRDAVGITPEENERGQQLFVQKGCVLCHRIGSRGGSAGPDLSYIGSWGLDREFLTRWIADPQGMKDQRIPVYWRSATLGVEVDTSVEKLEPPMTFMPQIAMSAEERDALVTYLLGLKLTK